MDQATARATDRLDVRLRPDIKEQIQQAAHIRGQNLTDFVISTLSEAAQDVIARQRKIILSARDFDLFMAALESDEEPNEVLRRAAERYRRNPL